MIRIRMVVVLCIVMAAILALSAGPAMADHWDYYDDPWGECGWMEVWDDSIFYPYYEFEGYEYDCHENYWDGPNSFWESPPGYWGGPDNNWHDDED